TRVDVRLVPGARGKELRAPRRCRQLSTRALDRLLTELGAAADRFHRHRLDHHLLATVDEAEARLMRFLEGALHRGQGARAYHQRRIRAGVADMRAHENLDLARWHALAGD